MTAFYPLISLISMAVFAWLGRRMATKRNRSPVGWMLAGAFFPPLLLSLLFMGATRPAETDEAANPGTSD